MVQMDIGVFSWIILFSSIFQVSRSEDDALKFIAIADWGGMEGFPYTTRVQKLVAQRLAEIVDRDGVSFILSLGDHFYPTGVKSANDIRFKITFEDVYKDKSLFIPWYLVAGNHDYYGNIKAQLDYSKLSSRWKYPDYYYKLTKHVPGGKTLDIILLDTVILCGNPCDTPSSMSDLIAAEREWAWLEHQLKSSTADYLLVAGHYPVYSVGFHGPTPLFIHRLKPLLMKYNVNAYIAGHDHNMQHIQMGKGGKTMNYFITGGTARLTTTKDHKNDLPFGALKYWMANPHLGGFTFFEVNDTAMTVKFINGQGIVKYKYDLQPRS